MPWERQGKGDEDTDVVGGGGDGDETRDHTNDMEYMQSR